MVNFARVRGLAVTVTWYQNKNILKVTWRSPDKKCVNRYITYWLMKNIARMSVMGEV